METPDYLVNEHFNDRYFDVVDALYESSKIYIEGNDILNRLVANKTMHKDFVVGETGFGAGRNLLALMYMIDTHAIKHGTIIFQSVELFPMAASRMEQILALFNDRASSAIIEFVKGYAMVDISVPGWHVFKLERALGTIEVRLFFGEALAMIQSLCQVCDAWFLDGHGPKKNPEIWRTEVLNAVGEKTHTNGTVGTFTVAGHVRRGLMSAGFDMERYPGFGGKKMAMRGVKR